jgi:4-amino-4-deoxy-L-arabinose transferase-like glycosyltransferase
LGILGLQWKKKTNIFCVLNTYLTHFGGVLISATGKHSRSIQRQSPQKAILLILGLALIIRVLAFIFFGYTNWNFGDAESYRNLSQNLAAGRGFQISIHVPGRGFDFLNAPLDSWYIVGRSDEPTAFYEPVFPLLLAGFYRIFGGQGDSIFLIFQILFGSWTCVLIYFLARRIAPDRGSLLVGLLAGIYPSLVFYSIVLMTDMLFFFVLLLCVLQGFRYQQQPNAVNISILALLTAMATLTRSVAVVAVPVMLIALLAIRRSWKIRAQHLLLYGVIISAFFGAWMWRNAQCFGRPILLPTKGAFNFWDTMSCLPRLLGDKGLLPPTREKSRMRWDLPQVETLFPELNRLDLLYLPDHWADTEPERAQQLTHITLSFLAANPSYAVSRYIRAAAKMYLPFMIETDSLVLQCGQGGAYIIVLVAGVWGWIKLRKFNPILYVIALSLLIYGLIVPIYSIQNSQRSRMPFDAMLIWMAAYGFQALYDRFGGRFLRQQ